ncbi:oxidoreductase C-terminal domain-containing protein [Streptomyces sp. NRRL S-146]
MTSKPEARRPFAPVPYFWSDQYGTRIQASGFLRGHDEVAVSWARRCV